jgi:hypothetical protein
VVTAQLGDPIDPPGLAYAEFDAVFVNFGGTQMSSKYVAIFIALIALGLSAALAQHTQTAPTTTCFSSTRGSSPSCPTYTAPAATAVPGTSMDGSITVLSQTTTPLFGGSIPPNGFMVQLGPQGGGNLCMVNDNGSATGAAGFNVQYGTGASLIYVTPPGYKPMGPVSIWCSFAGYVAARGW